jgi:hypothetical protein
LFYNDFVFPEFHILFKEQFQVSCVQWTVTSVPIGFSNSKVSTLEKC